MVADERDPYDADMVEIGAAIGYIAQLNSIKGRKKRHPIGFAPPKRRRAVMSGGRPAGTFPDVPRFDVP